MSKIVNGIGLYVSLVILNAGFLNADFRYKFKDFKYTCTEYKARETLGVSVGMSLLPPTWVLTPFITGFYYAGWTLNSQAWGTCK